MLSTGSTGDAVRDLQKQLSAAGFDPGLSDGIFGANTQTAVKAAQQHMGLSVDGIWGPKSTAALMGRMEWDATAEGSAAIAGMSAAIDAAKDDAAPQGPM